MKTSVIEVRDMLSVLSVDGVERRIGGVPGIESVTVNYAAGSATVRYDETRLDVADIKLHVRQSGYEPAAPAATSAGDGQQDKAAPIAQPSEPAAAEAKALAAAPAAVPAPAAPAAEGKEGRPALGAQPSTPVATAPKGSTAAPAAAAKPESPPAREDGIIDTLKRWIGSPPRRPPSQA